MALKYFLVFLLAYANCSPVDPPPGESAISPSARATNEEYRLPADAVYVISYDIELDVQDSTFNGDRRFGGHTIITFTSLRNTSEIKLHAIMNITEAHLFDDAGTEIGLGVNNFVSDAETQILTVPTNTQLRSGITYELHFRYIGELRTDMSGFYRSTYVDVDGNERVLGATQFESTSARKAFPSFDEPSYKAEFNLVIKHPQEYKAVANSKGNEVVDNSDPTNVFKTTTFETTPRMPTYLLAFVVSDFTCTQSASLIDGNIPSQICSRDEAAPTRELAVEYAPRLTKSLEDFTGVPYSLHHLPKLDHFAIPDFSAGAMENWGLITYRESALLWDPVDSSNRNKQRVITVIAHELGHFWFGDLVTTHWWSDIFLNEGFATYFEYHTSQEVDPSLELDKQFVLEQLQAVLVSDASPNSAPLSSPAYTPGQISGRFSSISYNKGGSVLRMVEKIVGLDNFKLGLNKYLTDNAFGNAKPENLWTALQTFAPAADLPPGVNLAGVMENWITKSGYPILNVTTDGANITITQQRFLSSGEPGADEKWYVPVSYTTAWTAGKFQSTKPNAWLLPNADLTIRRVLQNSTDWVILNNQQIGYYRVDYDKQLWERIKVGLNQPGFDGIHELNRAQLADDSFNFARYGRRSWSELLELYKFLKKDTSFYSWTVAFNAFQYITQRTTHEVVSKAMTAYVLELSEVFYSSVPFFEVKDNDQMFSLKKALLIPWSCRLGLQDCINNAVASFNEYKATNKKPDKNLRTTIYCNGLRYSQNAQEDFDFLWREFQTTKLSTEQTTILSVLGCAKDPAILRSYLSKSIDPTSGIRQQDASSVFSSIYTNNPEGVDIAFDFLIENYQKIADYYGTMNALSNLFSGLAGRFTRREQTDKLSKFIEENDLGSVEASAQASLNSALSNLEWTELFEKEMALYFVPEQTGSGASSIELTTLITTILLFCYQIFY